MKLSQESENNFFPGVSLLEQKEIETVSAVQQQYYELTFITPMVMHGLNNRMEAEFRTSSLKGVLRYWWRTLQFDKNKNELLEEEEKLFGGASTKYMRKSPLQIHISKPLKGNAKINILPHKSGNSSSGIKENETVTVILQMLKNKPDFEMYNDYFAYFLHLAGMGQRARRGFGACQTAGITWDSIEDFTSSLKSVLEKLDAHDKFTWNSGKSCILVKKTNVTSAHPTLYAVYVGKGKDTFLEILKDIGTASHFGNPRGSLGTTRNKGNASPLWCTVRKIGSKYYPIITELRTNRKKDIGGSYEQDKKIFLEKLGVI